jgi:hypothetical protein
MEIIRDRKIDGTKMYSLRTNCFNDTYPFRLIKNKRTKDTSYQHQELKEGKTVHHYIREYDKKLFKKKTHWTT